MKSQNATDHILINICAERQIDLLSNAWTAPARIALLHFDDGANDVGLWPLWSRLSPLLWRKQQPIFSLDQCAMEGQESRRVSELLPHAPGASVLRKKSRTRQ